MQAAVLSVKLPHLGQYNDARAKRTYNEGLCAGLLRPRYTADTTPCWHQYVVRTPYKYELCDYLQQHGIGSGTFYPVPLHLQKAFAGLGYQAGDLPVAERTAAETVCLPIFPELTEEEVSYVIDTVNAFFAEKGGQIL